jgi:membrane-bound metal-dependent hydrolase YbcI (DUF457 family)
MLPDIDSDTSKSFQECIYLTAGIGCILTASRLKYYGIDSDFAMFGGAVVFLLIRFALAPIIKKITVHRGMMHSIPMAILCGQLVFFVVTGTIAERLVKAAALTIGFLSHLILDEVFSIDSTGNTLRLKRSFGTALKWTNPKRPGSVTVIYSLVFLLGFAVCTNLDGLEWNNGVMMAEESIPNDIQREAVDFLLQLGTTSPAAQSNSTVVAPPSALELPSAMQIGNDWNRTVPLQPARIVLP